MSDTTPSSPLALVTGKLWLDVAVAGLVIFVVSRVLKYLDGLKRVGYLPGIRCPFDPLNFPGGALPSTWWNPAPDLIWLRRFDLYKTYDGADTISIVPFISGVPQLYTANLDVARQVVAGSVKESAWSKSPRVSKALLMWGVNLAAAEKDVWRRHRRIMGPAFNNKMYGMVWQKTLATYREWSSVEGWDEKDIIEVPGVQKYTFKLALLVIAACGFGVQFSWSEPPKSKLPDGTEVMSVQEALRVVSETIVYGVVLPKWAKKLPIPYLQRMEKAHKELDNFMKAQISERKAEIRGDDARSRREDVFSLLIRANEVDDEDLGSKQPMLSDQELIANVFILLVAGHETTAHTLAATLGLLSVHPEIQEEVANQIIEVVGCDRDPTFEDYDKLDKVVAAFYEALRLFPSGALMIREAMEDTVLRVPNPPGVEGEKLVPLPKGAQVTTDVVGIQYNPRYFPDPYEFKPSRWYNADGVVESEAYTAFSIGPRACIGRKFATVEAVCFLTMVLRDWKIEPLLNEGETVAQWKERILQATLMFTLAIRQVPVRFSRRRRV